MSLNSSRSANSNSNSNSKRSRNSNSSISKSDGKRRNSNQKTLGAAWGAKSHSSSRSSFRQAPFSDFGSYMAVKNQKLHEQFDAEVSTSSPSGSDSARPIFQGVSIFVDGFTIPSSQELRAYMLKHGGRFENYFSRHRVTHIICSNLPNSKIKNIRSFSGGLPVVKPKWVVDSVTANKLLSWIPYQLDQLANEISDQPKLSAFFLLKSSRAIKDANDSSTYTLKNEAEDSGSTGGIVNEKNSQEMDGFYDATRSTHRQVNDSWNSSMNATNGDDPVSRERDTSQPKIGNSCPKDAGYNTLNAELQSATPQPSTSANSHHLIKDSVKSSSSSLVGGPPNHLHSTMGDPCFVENYFKSSRLHFIGTWRNRYRKRFFNLSRGSKDIHANAYPTTSRRTIIHVDMDCFFVAVVIRNRPELQDKPVAVCHSDSPKGTAEISSANYPARDYVNMVHIETCSRSCHVEVLQKKKLQNPRMDIAGFKSKEKKAKGIRAGMFVRDAKALCPHLAIVPYNFEAYEEVADRLYDILHKHCTKVQAVSCDEAFLDVTESEESDPELLASVIRKEIFEATGCTASAGISGNVLMARLATRSAKPDGQCYIPPEKVDEHLLQLPIKVLPGIGRVLEEKLKNRQIQSCGQLRMISKITEQCTAYCIDLLVRAEYGNQLKECLQKDYGQKTGEMLWNYSRGIDNRLVGVIQESKSVGAEVNWGVRFKDAKDLHHFILSLCKEVSLRLQGCGVQGRTFTLKIKKRRKDAGDPVKYMGHGDCENLSHSTTVHVATDDVKVLQRIVLQLFGHFHIDIKDIRGVGLQVTKLESADYSEQGHDKGSLRSWLTSAAKHTNDQNEFQSPAEVRDLEGKGHAACELPQPTTSGSSNHEAGNQAAALPSMYDLDISVIQSLPPDLISEINDMYGGKLINLINKKKGKTEDCSNSLQSNREQEAAAGVIFKKGEASVSCGDQINIVQEKDLLESSMDKDMQTVPDSLVRPAAVVTSLQGLESFDLMPSSLSQIDASVLDQLPEELRVDIVTKLPEHRMADKMPHSSEICKRVSDDHELKELGSYENLFHGSPPRWVLRFKSSSCLILDAMAEMYFRCGCSGQLSCILQSCISQPQTILDVSDNEMEEATNSLYELLKQYIKLKLETDIEEIYVCFLLLKRFTLKSKALMHIYSDVLSYLQAAATEVYGGNLHLPP